MEEGGENKKIRTTSFMDDPSQLVKVVSHLSKKIARFVSLLKLLESSRRKTRRCPG